MAGIYPQGLEESFLKPNQHHQQKSERESLRSWQLKIVGISIAAVMILTMWFSGWGYYLASRNADDPHCGPSEAWIAQTDTCIPVVVLGGE